jgi:hypothetical protein
LDEDGERWMLKNAMKAESGGDEVCLFIQTVYVCIYSLQIYHPICISDVTNSYMPFGETATITLFTFGEKVGVYIRAFSKIFLFFYRWMRQRQVKERMKIMMLFKEIIQ